MTDISIFKILQTKLEQMGTVHLHLISLFLIVGIIVNTIVFIYETILLGLVLKNGVVPEEALSSIFWLVIMGTLLIFVRRGINTRKKDES